MKLLTTIAAVLISISGFSQDYVEYNEGVFFRYGKEISLDESGRFNKYNTKFHSTNGVRIRNVENGNLRVGMLSLSIIETPVAALGTGLFGLLSLIMQTAGIW